MGARERAKQRTSRLSKGDGSRKISQQKSSSSTNVSKLDPSIRAELVQGWRDYASSPNEGASGFSLRSVAKNTSSRGDWTTTRLRDNKITFVSAGHLTREELPESSEKERALNVLEQDAPREQQNLQESSRLATQQEAEPLNLDINEQVKQLDISGGSTESDHSSIQHRKTSVSSIQSDEVIVFAGRKAPDPVANPITSKSVTVIPVDSPALPIASVVEKEPPTEDKPTSNPSQWTSGAPGWTSDVTSTKRKQPKTWKKPLTRRQIEEEEEEAIMRDYIENMAVDDDDSDDAADEDNAQPVSSTSQRRNETFRFYDGTGEENVKVSTTASKGKKSATDLDMLVWDSDDLNDFEGLSTADEEVDEISQILRQRRRPKGLQYLVTAVGKDIGDAQWVPEEKMTSKSAREELRIWREIRIIEWKESDNLDDSDDSTDCDAEEAMSDLIDHIESEDEENTRIMERTNRMTDSMIARALQKQEELGLGGDDVMLFDGQEPDEELDEFERGDGFVSFSLQAHTSNRGRSKRNKRTKDTFPSASAFADALDLDSYGAFDIMDFDRPSLKPKKKGRKGELPAELLDEDNEWEAQLRAQWQTDRQKKSLRKQEREEARMAGLLGSASRNGQTDLYAKYANSGMDASQIKDEIRAFLVEEKFETLSLSSMDSAMRASVHRLAKALQLKSHSQGSGENRHPILTKTPRTPRYTQGSIWEIDALMAQRKFFPKNGGWGSSNRGGTPRGTAKIRRGGGGGALAGASYMDGDVVGASAPELGAENRGFALLQKMGWSSGDAIGALGNKGSVDVIKHVVKNTKAGLG